MKKLLLLLGSMFLVVSVSLAQGGRSVITPTESSRSVIQSTDEKPLWQQIQEEKEEKERLEKERIERERIERERIAAEKKAAEEKALAEKLEKERLEKERKVKEHEEWLASLTKQRFLLLNGGYSVSPEYSFGLTYGKVKVFGWYVNAMTNLSYKFSADYESDENGYVQGEKPFYTGVKNSTYMSLSFGGVARLHIPLYVYGGIGYSYRAIFYELSGGDWVDCKYTSAPSHGLHWEAGVLGNIKGFALSAGIASTTNFNANFLEAKVGIGCFIGKKK